MFVRNGIRSNLRERGRTALFSLLIVFLTLTLILSLSVLLYCDAVTDACNEAYRSVALVEYMGAVYPSEDVADRAARAAGEALRDEEILAVPGVTAWTRGNPAFAFAEGYTRRNGTMPYGTRAVIIINRVSERIFQWEQFDAFNHPIESEGSFYYYTATMKTSLYTRSGSEIIGREGTYIDILPGDSGFEPERGKFYVLNGAFLDTTRSAGQIGDYPMNGFAIFRVEPFLSSDDLPYYEYTEGEEIPEVFLRAAEQYRIMNNYIRVVPCRDVNDVQAFQQNELQLADGAMPDPGTPYACVISADLADRLDLAPGDFFSLEELRGTEDDCYILAPAGRRQTYTVSGVAGASSVRSGTVWAIAEDADTPLFGYLLGTASLRNEEGEDAAEALQALVPEGVRVTLLDQGYSSAVRPFREVRKTSLEVLLICSAGVTAVLLLFAFLFVGRQGSTVRIMVSLGTPWRKIALWFLSGALVICGVSVVLGTVLGAFLRPAVFRRIAEIAAAASAGEGDLWYSESAVGIVREMAFDPRVPLGPALAAAAGLLVIALLFCLLFLRLARRGGTRKRGKSRVRVPRGKTSVAARGGLRFALLSIRRGGLRSLAVPLVSFMLTAAVIVLGGVYQGWQDELDSALENTRIVGMVVSLNGRSYSGLSVPLDSVRTILGTEGIDSVSVSYGYHYWLTEDEPAFNYGKTGRARRKEWIAVQPEMYALNALDASAEFYFSDPAAAWLEGWDEAAFTQADCTPFFLRDDEEAEEEPIPVVCSTGFLEAHGMAVGDTFACMTQVEINEYNPVEIPLNVLVVGSYAREDSKAPIFVPLSCHAPAGMLTGDAVEETYGREAGLFAFRTCRFRLTSARELDAVRKRLRGEGFSAVGRLSSNRTTLILRDAAFLKLRESMERNIVMGRVMSAVLSALMVLLGFIVSWLMTFSRKREFALMRGFGAGKGRVFASFFLEQAILSLAGCLAACAALFRLYTGGVTQPLAVAAFLACYLLGTAVSVLLVGKTDLMELLTVRD